MIGRLGTGATTFIKGDTGPKGDTGATGPQGDPGPSGTNTYGELSFNTQNAAKTETMAGGDDFDVTNYATSISNNMTAHAGTGIVTIGTSGDYKIMAAIAIESEDSSSHDLTLSILRNGSTTVDELKRTFKSREKGYFCIDRIYNFSSSDTLQVRIHKDAGGSHTVNLYYVSFSAILLRST
jgi:hypothetical protein